MKKILIVKKEKVTPLYKKEYFKTYSNHKKRNIPNKPIKQIKYNNENNFKNITKIDIVLTRLVIKQRKHTI